MNLKIIWNNDAEFALNDTKIEPFLLHRIETAEYEKEELIIETGQILLVDTARLMYAKNIIKELTVVIKDVEYKPSKNGRWNFNYWANSETVHDNVIEDILTFNYKD